MENFGSDQVTLPQKIILFLACLHSDKADVSARWTWSQLCENVTGLFVTNEMTYQGDELLNGVTIYYLQRKKRREAIQEMRTSFEILHKRVEDAIDWSSDVIPFMHDRLNEIECSIPMNDIVYLLSQHGYNVDENNISLLQETTIPVIINVTSRFGSRDQYTALIYFNTCESERSDVFKERVSHLSQITHPNMMGCKELMSDEYNSIIILSSGNNYISLEDKISRNDGNLPQDCILSIFKQIVLCLEYLHNKNRIHCAIKPSNIFINNSNFTRIGDLSSSIYVSDDYSTTLLDNFQEESLDDIYSAPEMHRFVGVFSDIWSLGCVLVKMITLTDYKSESTDLMELKQSVRPLYENNFVEEIFELLDKMLILEESERITACEILKRSILKNVEIPPVEDHPFDFLSTKVVGEGGCGMVSVQEGGAVKEAHYGAEEFLENEKELLTYLECSGERLIHVVAVRKDCQQNLHINMEYCEKGNIEEIISSQRQGPISATKFISFVCQMAEAVKFLHECNILHRDIKPANFVVNNKDVVKIIDFGFSVVLSHGKQCTDTCGTLKYMAPEVVQGVNYSFPADIYSLGAVFYHIMKLRFTHSGETGEQRDVLKNKQLSDQFIHLIERMMDNDPRNRPTITEVCKVILLEYEQCSCEKMQMVVKSLYDAETTNCMDDVAMMSSIQDIMERFNFVYGEMPSLSPLIDKLQLLIGKTVSLVDSQYNANDQSANQTGNEVLEYLREVFEGVKVVFGSSISSSSKIAFKLLFKDFKYLTHPSSLSSDINPFNRMINDILEDIDPSSSSSVETALYSMINGFLKDIEQDDTPPTENEFSETPLD